MEKMVTRTRLVLGAAALLALIVVPVALAATDSGSQATASAAGVKKKIKRLAERVGELEQVNASLTQQVAALQGEQGGGRPPSGLAGGDLAGSYPDPSIGTGAVNSAKVADGSLGGTDIDPQTTIGLGQFPGARSVLSAADGLLTGVFTHNAFGTAVDPGGVEVFENTLSDDLSASLSASELSFHNALFSPVTFGADPEPLVSGETRYERTITLPETDPFRDPGDPPANSVRIYVDDLAGSTRLVARFADGTIEVLAEEAP